MAENEKQGSSLAGSRGKSLAERGREIVRQILEAIEELTRPEPVLVPVPVRARRR
jgi:hypothetical protein